MSKYNIASINLCTETEGPHKRLAIWFQGCNIGCKNCYNIELKELIPKNIISTDELVAIIKKTVEDNGIEGVTYLGGEPTLQVGLVELTKEIKKLGLGVISFTGRNYEDVKDILSGCDMVIDGPFIEEKIDSKRKIIGSTNQRIILLTDRYKDDLNWFYNNDISAEININDTIVINGDKIL